MAPIPPFYVVVLPSLPLYSGLYGEKVAAVGPCELGQLQTKANQHQVSGPPRCQKRLSLLFSPVTWEVRLCPVGIFRSLPCQVRAANSQRDKVGFSPFTANGESVETRLSGQNLTRIRINFAFAISSLRWGLGGVEYADRQVPFMGRSGVMS